MLNEGKLRQGGAEAAGDAAAGLLGWSSSRSWQLPPRHAIAGWAAASRDHGRDPSGSRQGWGPARRVPTGTAGKKGLGTETANRGRRQARGRKCAGELDLCCRGGEPGLLSSVPEGDLVTVQVMPGTGDPARSRSSCLSAEPCSLEQTGSLSTARPCARFPAHPQGLGASSAGLALAILFPFQTCFLQKQLRNSTQLSSELEH